MWPPRPPGDRQDTGNSLRREPRGNWRPRPGPQVRPGTKTEQVRVRSGEELARSALRDSHERATSGGGRGVQRCMRADLSAPPALYRPVRSPRGTHPERRYRPPGPGQEPRPRLPGPCARLREAHKGALRRFRHKATELPRAHLNRRLPACLRIRKDGRLRSRASPRDNRRSRRAGWSRTCSRRRQLGVWPLPRRGAPWRAA